MNKSIMKAFGFTEEIELIEDEICPFCKWKIDHEDFRDDLSQKEFSISGICQFCQDKIFGKV